MIKYLRFKFLLAINIPIMIPISERNITPKAISNIVEYLKKAIFIILSKYVIGNLVSISLPK